VFGSFARKPSRMPLMSEGTIGGEVGRTRFGVRLVQFVSLLGVVAVQVYQS
jgi:hypothetical protein